MSARRSVTVDGRRPTVPGRRLCRPRPAQAAGSGIALDQVELVRAVVDHPGGTVRLVRAGGRLVFVATETFRPGARVVLRIAPDLEWASDRFVKLFAGEFR